MNWEVKKATAANLEQILQSAPAGWKVFAVVPFGTAGEYLVIFKQGD
jgi:hypothetical protein